MAVIQYYITLWYIKLDFCYGKKLLVNPQGVDLGMYVYRNYRLIEESFMLKKQKPSEGLHSLLQLRSFYLCEIPFMRYICLAPFLHLQSMVNINKNREFHIFTLYLGVCYL